MKAFIKTLATIAVFAATIQATAAQETAQTGTLTVRVEGIRNNQGNIMAAVGDYKVAPQKMIGKMMGADSTGVTIVFDNIPVGAQKVYLFHDENGNFDLDRDEKGIPAEGFGMVKDGNASTDYETPVLISKKLSEVILYIYYPKSSL